MPRDKKPGLLYPLPVPNYPWQYIIVDFKSYPESKSGYNIVTIFVDYLSKYLITIPI
jgi:hypothetical protein